MNHPPCASLVYSVKHIRGRQVLTNLDSLPKEEMMGIRNRFILPLAFLTLVFSQLLLACQPSLEQEQAEDELVAFMLDHSDFPASWRR